MPLRAAISGECSSRAQCISILQPSGTAVNAQAQQALDGMRQQFEAQVDAARGEVARAQDALRGAEERVRASEQVRLPALSSRSVQVVHLSWTPRGVG